MTDEAYIFKQDVRDKAITARSSHKVGSSRRRKCSFASDRLTKKEWEKLNGPIHTVTPGEPMTWEAFKAVPDTLQTKYIEGILEKYKVGPNAIARMFGISGTYCGNYLRSLGFTFSGHTTPSEAARFLRDYGKVEEAESKSAAGKKNTALERLSLTFSGGFSPEAITEKLQGLFESGQEVIVTVEALAQSRNP